MALPYHPAMNIVVVSCSLNPDSRSAVLAARAAALLGELGHAVRLIDLRTGDLPFCDGCDVSGHSFARDVQTAIAAADAVVLSVPIYNFDANAASKNLIELTGRAWRDKVVGFVCAAGGRGSYMAIMAVANSLMLDFRCLVVPRFVFATGADFEPDGRPGGDIDRRLGELCGEVARIAAALRTSGAASQA